MADFFTAYNNTSKTEGGYANIPGDTGGETYAGISRKWFPSWPGWSIIDSLKPLRSGQKLASIPLSQMVKDFYKKNFWDPIGGDGMQSQDLANQVYDMAVNSGVGTALKLLNQS